MRKLIFLLFLLPLFCFGQIKPPYKIVYPVASNVAKLDFSKVANPASPAGWNRINYDGTLTTALLTPTGVSTGWSFVFNQAVSGDAGSNYESGFPALGDPDFPDVVVRGLWYFDIAPNNINISFTGLNPAKTYNVLFAAYGQGSQDGLTVTLGATTYTGSAFNTLYKPLFTAISPNGSGVLSGTISRTTYYGVMSALIITEN